MILQFFLAISAARRPMHKDHNGTDCTIMSLAALISFRLKAASFDSVSQGRETETFFK